MLLAVFLTDWAKRTIPDRLLLGLAANRVVWFFALGEAPEAAPVLLEVLKACAVPAVLLVLVLLAEKFFQGREIMGGGDIKLLSALALYLSWVELMLALLIGCAAGLLFAALARKKRGAAVAFGPFLTLGALAAVCFGAPLIEWYFSLF